MKKVKLSVILAFFVLSGAFSCGQRSTVSSVISDLDASKIDSPVKNHLVAQWLFDGNANDTSGNGHDGTVDGASLTNDRFGTTNAAYWFDGLSASIEADIPEDVFKGDFTLCLWMKIDHYNNVYATMVSSRNYNFLFQALGEGIGDEKLYCPEFYFYDDITEAHIGKTTSTYRMPAGEWIFLTALRKGDKSYLIVNSTNLAGPVIADPKDFTRVINHLFFAKTEFGRAPEYFPGAMDDIRLFDRALNDNEIQRLYGSKKGEDLSDIK